MLALKPARKWRGTLVNEPNPTYIEKVTRTHRFALSVFMLAVVPLWGAVLIIPIASGAENRIGPDSISLLLHATVLAVCWFLAAYLEIDYLRSYLAKESSAGRTELAFGAAMLLAIWIGLAMAVILSKLVKVYIVLYASIYLLLTLLLLFWLQPLIRARIRRAVAFSVLNGELTETRALIISRFYDGHHWKYIHRASVGGAILTFAAATAWIVGGLPYQSWWIPHIPLWSELLVCQLILFYYRFALLYNPLERSACN